MFHKPKRREIPIHRDPNPYYETLSERFGIAQVILYMGLLAFVVLSFLANTNLITYQNFYHFFKDLNSSLESVDVMYSDTLVYPSSEKQSFTLYRNGLAVAGNSSVTVFTPTGRQTVSETLSYHDPIAVGSGKYLLVYDQGGTRYSLYNSYTKLHEDQTEYPITGATVAENGMYVLITSAANAASVAEVYSDDFAILNRFTSKNGYYMDAAIHPKGNSVALLSSSANLGAFSTTLTVCSVGASSATVSEIVSDSLALVCEYTASDRLTLLCSDRVLFYKTNGQKLGEESFWGERILAFDIGESGTALCLAGEKGNQKNRLIVFDKQGGVLYNKTDVGRILRLSRYENQLFLLREDRIDRIDMKKNTEHPIKIPVGECSQMIAVNDREVLFCTAKKAYYLRVSA